MSYELCHKQLVGFALYLDSGTITYIVTQHGPAVPVFARMLNEFKLLYVIQLVTCPQCVFNNINIIIIIIYYILGAAHRITVTCRTLY